MKKLSIFLTVIIFLLGSLAFAERPFKSTRFAVNGATIPYCGENGTSSNDHVTFVVYAELRLNHNGNIVQVFHNDEFGDRIAMWRNRSNDPKKPLYDDFIVIPYTWIQVKEIFFSQCNKDDRYTSEECKAMITECFPRKDGI